MRSSNPVKTFSTRMALLFAILAVVTGLSQFLYSSSIAAMRRSLARAVDTAEIIHHAESFHLSTHSLMSVAANRDRIGHGVAAMEYRDYRERARATLADFLATGDRLSAAGRPRPGSFPDPAVVEGKFRSFLEAADRLMAGSPKARDALLEVVEARFDDLFGPYLETLDEYHEAYFVAMEGEAGGIVRTVDSVFVAQLVFVTLMAALAVLFALRALFQPYRRAARYATTDQLTGAGNRRYLDIYVLPELEDRVRSGAPFALALADIDRFKDFNDGYGHQAGDEALRVFASVLRSGLRSSDEIVRYGGEEFLVVLPGAAREEAEAVVEKLRDLVESAAIRVAEGREAGVTASFGLAVSPGDRGRPAELLAAADRRLYEAKRRGRNRVVSTDD